MITITLSLVGLYFIFLPLRGYKKGLMKLMWTYYLMFMINCKLFSSMFSLTSFVEHGWSPHLFLALDLECCFNELFGSRNLICSYPICFASSLHFSIIFLQPNGQLGQFLPAEGSRKDTHTIWKKDSSILFVTSFQKNSIYI